LTLFRASAIVFGMGRILLVALLGMRALALLFAVELSGLTHAAVDVVCSLSGNAHQESDCDDEQGGHECPPGCPSCHCWHAGAPTAPLRMPPGRRIVVVLTAQLGFVPGVAMPRAGADPDAIYRPPRAAARS
jgi:hypothetical protein